MASIPAIKAIKQALRTHVIFGGSSSKLSLPQAIPLRNNCTLLKMPHINSVVTMFIVRAGFIHEPPGKEGIAHLLEHFLFFGSKNYPSPEAISRSPVEKQGGELNGITFSEVILYYARTLRNDFEISLDILSDIVFNPILSPRELENARQQKLGALNMARNDPYSWVQILIKKLLFPGSSLAFDFVGTEESIKSISIGDICDFYRNYYCKDNVEIIVAGNISSKQVESGLRRISFTAVTQRSFKPVSQSVIEDSMEKLLLEKRDIEGAELCFGFKTFGRNHKDRFVLEIISVLLGENSWSRVYNRLRNERGIAYDVELKNEFYAANGALLIYSGFVTKNNALEGTKEILDILKDLRCGKIDEEELQDAKKHYLGKILLDSENPFKYAYWIGTEKIMGNQIITLRELERTISEITLGDVIRVVNDIFRKSNIHLAIIGKFDDVVKFEEILDRF